MRIISDLGGLSSGSPSIIQVDNSSATTLNIDGKWVIPSLSEFPINEDSYILDGGGKLDGSDVVSSSFSVLLNHYQQYDNVYFNPLITPEHLNDLDLGAVFADRLSDPPQVHQFTTRFKTGRGSAFPIVGPNGNSPGSTALLPVNVSTTPPRPGLLITKEIDVSAESPDGTTDFLVYWKLYGYTTSEDSPSSGSSKQLHEVPQEPDDFSVFMTTNNGSSWCNVGLLEPTRFATPSTKFRLAFLNKSSNVVYLNSYAVLF